MRVVLTSDVVETKMTALFYLLGVFCNDDAQSPMSDFSRFCSATASTEDLIAALELPEADRADCDSWQISPDQWRSGIRQALYQHIVEAIRSEASDGDLPNTPIHERPGQC